MTALPVPTRDAHHPPTLVDRAARALARARNAELLDTPGTDFTISGCLDAPMLERSVATLTRGRDALNSIPEASHA